jgi:hypothetical protein
MMVLDRMKHCRTSHSPRELKKKERISNGHTGSPQKKRKDEMKASVSSSPSLEPEKTKHETRFEFPPAIYGRPCQNEAART